MLNGVGGRTVEEAKERMTYAEALQWQDYLTSRGTVHVGMRLEAGFALIAMSINHALGGKATIEQFMPHFDEPQASLEDVMQMLTGGKNGHA